MKNLEYLIPLAVMAAFAAMRYWVLPHVHLGPVQTLFPPLEIAAYAISAYIYARRPQALALTYAALPMATLLWKDVFNFVSVAISLIN